MPASHHSMPESVMAIKVLGRPVVTCHALSTLLPSTPHSSCGLSATVGSDVRALVSFQLPPPLLQFAGRTGIEPGSVWSKATACASLAFSGIAGHGKVPRGVCCSWSPVLGSCPPAGAHDAGRLLSSRGGVLGGGLTCGLACCRPAVANPAAAARVGA